MQLKRIFTFSFLISVILPGNFLSSHTDSQSSFPCTSYKLKNGLQVILSEDFSLPIVSVAVAYRVGSMHEEQGKSGLAYLLENLMFHGSRNIGRMQHISFIQRIGGELNAITDVDKTIFLQTVSSHQLASVLWLESDRMNSLSINSANVQRVKNALIEEIQLRKVEDPFVDSTNRINELLFPDHAYHHPVRGKEADLREITVQDAMRFYQTYYRPNNAVLCITGHIDKTKTNTLIKKYFETIPRGEDIPQLPLTEPWEMQSSTTDILNPLISTPAYFLGFRLAKPLTSDYYTLAIIDYILLKGNSSRLYTKLFKKERLAYQLNGTIDKRKDLAVYKIFVRNTNEIMLERSQKAIFSEINRLKSNPISEKELQKAKNLFKIDYIRQFSTSRDKAIFLVEAALSGIDLMELDRELDKYMAVTPMKVIGIANRYFIQEGILLNIKTK